MINEKIINERVGKNIRKYRLLYSATKHNLTQSDLAEKVGVSVSLIGGMESKNINQGISIYNLFKISEVLNTPIDKFFE
jgi:transcriptional regulator with XRE-family HTH domain